MDIVKLIADKTAEFASNGKIEEIVEKHLTSCLNKIVEDSFTWSGEGKKAIETALKDKLSLPLSKINLSQYQLIIGKIVEDQINNTAIESAKEKIQESIKEITGHLDKKEFKLSEIIHKYIESIDTSYHGGMEDQYGEISLHVKDNDGDFVWVRFDKECDKENYQCENSLHLYKGKLSGVTLDEKPFSPFESRAFDSFEKFMFSLYSNNVSIIVDEDQIEKEYCREDAH